jgi:hypothetical protein
MIAGLRKSMQTSSRDEMSRKTLLTLVLLFVALVWCAGLKIEAQTSQSAGATPPVRLDVSVSPPQVRDGESVVVRLLLTNTSKTAIAGCARAWEDYIAFGNKGKAVGRNWVDDGVPPENLFVLPPGHTLSWQLTVAPKRLGVGPASLVAQLTSDCNRDRPFGRGISAWNGTIYSQPVPFTVVE